MSNKVDSFGTFYSLNKVNKKNPIVFIHGVGLNKEIWDPQINFFKNYNTLTYDLLGHGKTPLKKSKVCLLYTSPSPRDLSTSRMPSSA